VAARGTPIDRRLVEAAGLLHDVDKLLPDGDPLRRRRHGDGSAAWLIVHGHPEMGPVVADHPVTRLVDGSAFAAWLAGAGVAARIVAYADKRAGQRLEPMRARFASWASRYPDGRGWDASIRAVVAERALLLEADVCRRAGVAPDEVRRLAWTGSALRGARARA
jgi:hypothetical protein